MGQYSKLPHGFLHAFFNTCISLRYICPLSEPGFPWHSIKRNLTVFSSVFFPLRSPLKEGSVRGREWGIHEGQGGGGGGDHNGGTTKVKVHTGKPMFLLIHSSIVFSLVLFFFVPLTWSRLGMQWWSDPVMWLVLIGPSWAGGWGGTGSCAGSCLALCKKSSLSPTRSPWPVSMLIENRTKLF